MITAEQIAQIGTGPADTSTKLDNPRVAELQAMVNIMSALQAIALVLVDIRDGRKGDRNKVSPIR